MDFCIRDSLRQARGLGKEKTWVVRPKGLIQRLQSSSRKEKGKVKVIKVWGFKVFPHWV